PTRSVAFIDPDGMLKGWNSNVRMTTAMMSAWIMTRMVSPTPLSAFVFRLTLIIIPLFDEGLVNGCSATRNERQTARLCGLGAALARPKNTLFVQDSPALPAATAEIMTKA